MANNNKILYLFGYSLNNYKKFNKIVEIIDHQLESDVSMSFVFLHDGVIGLTTNSDINVSLNNFLDLNLFFYVLLPDLKVRGIDPKLLNNKIKKIGYDRLVDLLVENPRIISWL